MKRTRLQGNAALVAATMLGLSVADMLEQAVRGIRAPRPTGNPTPASLERRARRNADRMANALAGGFHNHGLSVRAALEHAPINEQSRQRKQIEDRKAGIEKPRHPCCRKYGPRGLRAAKQFADRAGVDIS